MDNKTHASFNRLVAKVALMKQVAERHPVFFSETLQLLSRVEEICAQTLKEDPLHRNWGLALELSEWTVRARTSFRKEATAMRSSGFFWMGMRPEKLMN